MQRTHEGNPIPPRRTIVVGSPTAFRMVGVQLARDGERGVALTTMDALVARLASPFLEVASTSDVRRVVRTLPDEVLGDLARVAGTTGFASALATTLRRCWMAAVDLAAEAAAAAGSSRWRDLAAIESAVAGALPAHVALPTEAARLAVRNAALAPPMVGPVHVDRWVDVPVVYRPVLEALAEHVPVTWETPPGGPTWTPKGFAVREAERRSPTVEVRSYATPSEEARGALRWARGLLERGVPHADVAIAALTTTPYDETFLAVPADGPLPVHVAHGRPLLDTPRGQLVASVVDLFERPPTRDRVRRLVELAHHVGIERIAHAIPLDWDAKLPLETTLARREHWVQRHHQDRVPAAAWEALVQLVHDADGQATGLQAFAERWLDADAQETVDRILESAPFGAWAWSLEGMRIPDETDVRTSVLWTHAEALPSRPRPYTWLLGLSSRDWPRPNEQDPLLPLRILESRGLRLEERTRGERDRASFDAIRASTEHVFVASRPRATSDGKPRSPSPLLAALPGEERVVPYGHRVDPPFDERDRLAYASDDVLADAGVRAAISTHQAWTRDPSLTEHDGRVRADHPAIQRALEDPISPSKLVKMVRDPFGFVGTHVHRWREPPLHAETLTMEARDVGTLFHHVIERTVDALGERGTTFSPNEPAALVALDAVLDDVREAWGETHALPPHALWLATLEDVRAMARQVLDHARTPLDGERSYTEVRFGYTGSARSADAASGPMPWDPTAPYVVPGADLQLRGIIDRVDVSEDQRYARVIDYKTGAVKSDKELGEGREVQRAAYASVVRSHLPAGAHVDAALVYVHPTRLVERPLPHPVEHHETALARALGAARTRLLEGLAHPGRDALVDHFRDHRIALPAAARDYERLKEAALHDHEQRVLVHVAAVEPAEPPEDHDATA